MRRVARLAVALAAALLASHAWADEDTYAAVMRGRALATAGDCVACHTAPGGTPYAGGLGLETPFGAILTANITPDDGTGIGHWSADDFYRAMHWGIRPDGAHLYPAFPYTYYTKLTRDDTDAIYAFLRSLPPTQKLIDRQTLPFPFNIRASMAAWNTLFFSPGTYFHDPNKSEEYNRGAYLVEGAGHCGACHTPLNFLGANKDSAYLEGNRIDEWTAPNITADTRRGIGGWSLDAIVTYLHTGRNATSIASGPMAEVVQYSTSQMPESDLHAIAVYLKAQGGPGVAPPQPMATDTLVMRAGEAIYVDTCSACHTRTGAGIANIFPRLAGNPVVQQDDPASLIRVVLTGSRGAATTAAPTAPAMPSLGWRLTDDQIASVVTYIRNSWGNAAGQVTASDVAALRKSVGTPRQDGGTAPHT